MAFRNVYFASLSFLLAALIMTPPSVSAQSARLIDVGIARQIGAVVPNFGVVDASLSRGGQPKNGGLQALKSAGVKTIINLRDGEDDIDEEREIAANLGLKYVSIPMSALNKPRPDQIRTFLQTVRAPENQPAFVHCRQGKDRTGALVAIYRMDKDGWSADQAHAEMKSYGFHQIFAGLTSSVYTFGNNRSVEGSREAGGE